MQSNKDDNPAIFVFALVATAAYFLLAALFALAIVATAVLTVLSFCAWNRPISVAGVEIDPEEAQTFVFGGLAFAGLSPFVLLILQLLSNARLNGDYLFHVVVGAYVVGAFFSISVLGARREREATQIEILPPSVPPVATKDTAPERPFFFADWDDKARP